MFNICVFKCDWVDSRNGVRVDELGFTLVDLSKIGHKSDPFILATQAQQVFYVKGQVDLRWSIVLSRPKIVTPQTRGSVDNPSTRGIQVEVGLPDATLENRAESPLYGELYPNKISV